METDQPARDFTNLTDRSWKVINLARQVAKEFKHNFVGTEHILIALVRENSGVAASVLKDLNVAHLVEKEVRDLLGIDVNKEEKDQHLPKLMYCQVCKLVYYKVQQEECYKCGDTLILIDNS